MKEEKKIEFSTLHRLFMWLTLLVTFALVSLWFNCRYMHLLLQVTLDHISIYRVRIHRFHINMNQITELQVCT